MYFGRHFLLYLIAIGSIAPFFPASIVKSDQQWLRDSKSYATTTYLLPQPGVCELPEDFDDSRVELRYSVGQSCVLYDVQIVLPEQSSELKEWANCILRNYWKGGVRLTIEQPINFGGSPLTIAEYQALWANDVAQNPDRFHLRQKRINLRDGSRGMLTCWFSEDWVPTGAELTIDDGNQGVTEPFDQFSEIPEQSLEILIGSPND
jgi:hypothetical protein